MWKAVDYVKISLMIFRNWVERIKIYFKMRFTSPFRFGKWIELEEIKNKIAESVRTRSADFPELVYEFTSRALHVRKEYFRDRPWEEVMSVFLQISSLNAPPQSLPLIARPSPNKKDKDVWDYPGRTWYLYSHLLAQAYGWTLDTIADLPVSDALSLVQEVLTDEQLEREFLWGMSEKSVSYNAKTKTSRFNELPRPYWMKKELKPVQKITMHKDMLPAGMVNNDAIPEEFRPKTINP